MKIRSSMPPIQVKVRFDHSKDALHKILGLTVKDSDAAFDLVWNLWFNKEKSASQIMEKVLNADLSAIQKTFALYILGRFVGENEVKTRAHHMLDHLLDPLLEDDDE